MEKEYKFIIDRFEGNYALCELDTGVIISVPKDIIPLIAKEGDIIELKVLKDEAEANKVRVKNKYNHLWE